MASFKEIDHFFDNLDEDFFKTAVPNIIAEKATEYFKQRFTTKEWSGKPWPETKKPVKRGSLMVRSGALVNSIKPSQVNSVRVVISAGSDKVPYAKIHNEGGVIDHPGGTPFFIEKKSDNRLVFVSKKKASELKAYKNTLLPVTKPHKIPIPQRQFMGISQGLKDYLFDNLQRAFNSFLKTP